MVWQRVMTTATRGYQALAAAEQSRAAGTDDPACGPRPSPLGGARAVDRHNLEADLRQVRNDWVCWRPPCVAGRGSSPGRYPSAGTAPSRWSWRAICGRRVHRGQSQMSAPGCSSYLPGHGGKPVISMGFSNGLIGLAVRLLSHFAEGTC